MSQKKSACASTGTSINSNFNLKPLEFLAILVGSFAIGVALGRFLELMGVVGC